MLITMNKLRERTRGLQAREGFFFFLIGGLGEEKRLTLIKDHKG